MAANRYFFEVARGEDLTMAMTARDRSMAIVDLTDGSVSVRFASGPGASSALTLSATLTSATLGQFSVTMTDTQSLLLADGLYFFSALFTDSGGLVSRVAEGTLRLLDRIEP